MISLILPIYNDVYSMQTNIPKIIKKMDSIKRKFGELYEIIVVEESTDSTPEVIEKFAKRNRNIIHLHFNKRLGKGSAITKGIMKSRGNKIIFMDVDLSTDITALDNLIEKLDNYDIVVGSRFHPESTVIRPYYRSILGFGLSVIARLLFGVPVRDTQCGFKGFRKDAIRHILGFVKNEHWFWDIEVLYYAKKFSYKTCEIPVIWKYNTLKNYKIFDNILFYVKNIARFMLEK